MSCWRLNLDSDPSSKPNSGHSLSLEESRLPQLLRCQVETRVPAHSGSDTKAGGTGWTWQGQLGHLLCAGCLSAQSHIPPKLHVLSPIHRESLQRLRNLSEVPESQDLNPNYLSPSPVPPAHAQMPSTVYQGLRQKSSSCDLSATPHSLL